MAGFNVHAVQHPRLSQTSAVLLLSYFIVSCATRNSDRTAPALVDTSAHQWKSVDPTWSACTASPASSKIEFPPLPSHFRVFQSSQGSGYIVNACSDTGKCSEASAYGSIFQLGSTVDMDLHFSQDPKPDATLVGTPILAWSPDESGACIYSITRPDLRRDETNSSWILRVQLEEYRVQESCNPETFKPAGISPECTAERSARAERIPQ